MDEKKERVNPRDYYQKLNRKEKSEFLNYLLLNFGMNYSTIRRKLSRTPLGELTKLEMMTINNVIENELWKQ
jgi:hypothetical protein